MMYSICVYMLRTDGFRLIGVSAVLISCFLWFGYFLISHVLQIFTNFEGDYGFDEFDSKNSANCKDSTNR